MGITATDLMDSDGIAGTPEYKWYRTSSRTATGTEIDGATTTTYPPTDAAGNSDVGMYLRVVATYTDGGPSRGNKTATAVSDYVTMNRISNNAPPMFPSATTTRAVLEETRKGTAIGIPITATDADSGEKLTYWLTNDTDENFEIDPAPGS